MMVVTTENIKGYRVKEVQGKVSAGWCAALD